MKNNLSFLLIVAFVLASCLSTNVKITKAADENPNSLSIKLVNGNWFNGETFENKTVWVNNGILSFEDKNTKIDTTIDLTGKYVIPPFAEAHNHNLESDYKIDDAIRKYLNNGVFYVKMLSSIKKRIDIIKDKFNKPGCIDVFYAHAPLTGSGGHPIKLRESFFDMGRFEGVFNSKEEIEGHGYYIIDTKKDLDIKWPAIISQSPDFIKIMLLWSEEYEKRKDDTAYFGQKGLNPLLVPDIVQKAHEQGLRVSAHVESAYDFHIAVTAGVDEIAHMPCIEKVEQLDSSDIALAKKNETVVVTTVSLVEKYKDHTEYDSLVDNLKEILLLLKNAGVKIAVGSDIFTDNSYKEAALLNQWGIFTNLELLKMWCENSAMTTFPDRKIGYLKEGYEASFLVLGSNPLNDMKEINKSIILKVKQGMILAE